MAEELKPKAEPEIDIEEQLVYESFELKADDRLRLEKKILSIAFLLEACSQEGNEPVHPAAANGFATVLREAVGEVGDLRRKLQRQEEELSGPDEAE
jgi:hypothetical protein